MSRTPFAHPNRHNALARMHRFLLRKKKATIEKQIGNAEREIEQRSGGLDSLRKDLAALEVELIDNQKAIDNREAA